MHQIGQVLKGLTILSMAEDVRTKELTHAAGGNIILKISTSRPINSSSKYVP